MQLMAVVALTQFGEVALVVLALVVSAWIIIWDIRSGGGG